ncbi:MAG: endonuclease III [Myxococcales bacterium]|nr:endonuclease III [Myxococcales bacterium]
MAKRKDDDAARRERLYEALDAAYPDPRCELDFETPLQLLVATILSAQCTDERVNQVTPALFARFPDAGALASSDSAELEGLIRSTGFYRNKAKAIRTAAKQLVDDHGGEVPRDFDALCKLSGVARKTANLVMGIAFGEPTGFVVDTHVKRLAGRLGFSNETKPEKIERDLCAVVPQARWIRLGTQLILHGRRVCAAKKPDCAACTLSDDCPSAAAAT